MAAYILSNCNKCVFFNKQLLLSVLSFTKYIHPLHLQIDTRWNQPHDLLSAIASPSLQQKKLQILAKSAESLCRRLWRRGVLSQGSSRELDTEPSSWNLTLGLRPRTPINLTHPHRGKSTAALWVSRVVFLYYVTGTTEPLVRIPQGTARPRLAGGPTDSGVITACCQLKRQHGIVSGDR